MNLHMFSDKKSVTLHHIRSIPVERVKKRIKIFENEL